MLLPESFNAASKAVEEAVEFLASVHHFAECGKVEDAYQTLEALWALHRFCWQPIHDARDELAYVSDGIIRHHGLTGTRSYVSAHEAVVDICLLAYFGFLVPLGGVTGDDKREALKTRLLSEQLEGLAVDSSLLRARIRRERAKLLDCDKKVPEAKTDDKKDWILVTEALTQLPFIKDLDALYKYAEENPDKLRLRPHPTHKKRRQASAADVLRLEIDYNNEQFEAMGSPAAAKLSPLSEGGLADMAERMKQANASKRK